MMETAATRTSTLLRGLFAISVAAGVNVVIFYGLLQAGVTLRVPVDGVPKSG
jgi:hypothetical protein